MGVSSLELKNIQLESEDVEPKIEDVLEKAPWKDRYDRYTNLPMKQVPRSTADDFIKLADEEFGGHWGFCLKALLDQVVVQRQVLNESRFDELEERVSVIEHLLRNLIVESEEKKINERDEDVKQQLGRRTVAGNNARLRKDG